MKSVFFTVTKVLFIFLATLSTTYVFGQDLVIANTEAVEHVSFADYFFNFFCFVLFLPFVVESVKSILPNLKKGSNLILSWVLGVAATLILHWISVGVFGDISFSKALAVGFGATLASNGVFDSGFTTFIIKLFSKDTKE